MPNNTLEACVWDGGGFRYSVIQYLRLGISVCLELCDRTCVVQWGRELC